MDAVAVHLDTVLPMLTETLMCPLDVNQSVLNIRCLRVVRSLQMLKSILVLNILHFQCFTLLLFFSE